MAVFRGPGKTAALVALAGSGAHAANVDLRVHANSRITVELPPPSEPPPPPIGTGIYRRGGGHEAAANDFGGIFYCLVFLELSLISITVQIL